MIILLSPHFYRQKVLEFKLLFVFLQPKVVNRVLHIMANIVNYVLHIVPMDVNCFLRIVGFDI